MFVAQFLPINYRSDGLTVPSIRLALARLPSRRPPHRPHRHDKATSCGACRCLCNPSAPTDPFANSIDPFRLLAFHLSPVPFSLATPLDSLLVDGTIQSLSMTLRVVLEEIMLSCRDRPFFVFFLVFINIIIFYFLNRYFRGLEDFI